MFLLICCTNGPPLLEFFSFHKFGTKRDQVTCTRKTLWKSSFEKDEWNDADGLVLAEVESLEAKIDSTPVT